MHLLKSNGWLHVSNKNYIVLENPSYSIMNSLKEGYQIIMHISLQKKKTLILHKNIEYSIILGRAMAIFCASIYFIQVPTQDNIYTQ